MVDYISNLRLLDDMNVELSQIEKFNSDNPREFEFLKTLSDYYKGNIEIPDEDLVEMRNCNVYLKNIKTWNSTITMGNKL